MIKSHQTISGLGLSGGGGWGHRIVAHYLNEGKHIIQMKENQDWRWQNLGKGRGDHHHS